MTANNYDHLVTVKHDIPFLVGLVLLIVFLVTFISQRTKLYVFCLIH